MKIKLILLFAIFAYTCVAQDGAMHVHYKNSNEILSLLVSDIDSITFTKVDTNWTSVEQINTSISELYLPDLEERYGDCHIGSISVGFGCPRLFILNNQNELVALCKEYSQTFTDDYYKANSISPIIDANTLETIGFCKFEKDFKYANSGINIRLNSEVVGEITNSPIISAMLSNKKQIVLLGDSKYGNYWSNCLPDMLMGMTGCYVANCGFGDCRMAWRTRDGSDSFDYFSFSSICDALESRDFSLLDKNMPLSVFRYQLHCLKSLNLNKETVFFINFNDNDITKSSPLGEDYSHIPTIEDLDRAKFVDAIYYGVLKVQSKYPSVRFVFLSPAFKYVDDIEIDAYVNDLGLTIWDYDKSEKNAVQNLGCDYIDSYNLAFRSPKTIMDFTIDGTHFNGAGFSRYARFLYSVYKFLDYE